VLVIPGMQTTHKRKPRRTRTIKQIATKVMRTAEDEAQKLIRGARELQRKSKRRVQKRATRKKTSRARAHAS
jgi:hypothetical protein